MEARPIITTSAPARVAPSAKAWAIPGELGRMSWPTTTVGAPVTSTNAVPVSRASSSSSWSGTVPRTS